MSVSGSEPAQRIAVGAIGRCEFCADSFAFAEELMTSRTLFCAYQTTFNGIAGPRIQVVVQTSYFGE